MEKIPEDEGLEVPDYDIDDQTRIFKNVLPFEEGEYEYEKEQKVPDYGILKEDIILEKALLPDLEDETLPGEKQGPSAFATPPPYSYPKGRSRATESSDLSTLTRFLNDNKGDPNAVVGTPKSKFYGWDKKKVEAEIKRIYSNRAISVLQKKSIRQKNLGPFAGKSRKQIREMLEIEGKSVEEVHKMKPFANDTKSIIQKCLDQD